MEKTREQKEALSKQLVAWFGEIYDSGPCACVGIRCQTLGCSLWWRHFLDLSPAQLQRLLSSGTKHAYDGPKSDLVPGWLVGLKRRGEG